MKLRLPSWPRILATPVMALHLTRALAWSPRPVAASVEQVPQRRALRAPLDFAGDAAPPGGWATPPPAPMASLISIKNEAVAPKCPPAQPCNCHCHCPETIWGVPPPGPMLPTPVPFFSLVQRHKSAAQDGAREVAGAGRHLGAQVPGFMDPA